MTTELQRILYMVDGHNVTWLAERIGVSRQVVGYWVRGLEKVPRRRQAQIRVHLEEPTRPLFDRDGVALKVGETR